MIDDLLRQAVTAIKSGDKALGKQLLIQVLEQDSRNEYAWLWLSQCITSHEQKLDCIKRVLDINPNNTTAQKELARLQTLSQVKAQPVAAKPPVSTKPPQKKAKSTNSFLWIFVGVIAVGCVCILALGVLWNSGSSNSSINTGGGDTNTNGGDTSAWVPSGFEKWNNEIAYRFVEGKACSYDIAEACAHYEFFTRYGCPTSLYVEVAFMNSSGTQVDWSNDTATSLSSGTKALLEFVSFESSATKVKVTQIVCY